MEGDVPGTGSDPLSESFNDFAQWLREPGAMLRSAETRRLYRSAAEGQTRRLVVLGLLGVVLAVAYVMPALTLRPVVAHPETAGWAEVVPFLLSLVGIGLLEALQPQLIGTVVAEGTRRLSVRAFDSLLRAPAEWFGALPLGSSVKVTVEDAPEAARGLSLAYQLAYATARLGAVLAGMVVILPTTTGLGAAAAALGGLYAARRVERVVMAHHRRIYVTGVEMAEYVAERCQDASLAEIRTAGTASSELAGLTDRLARLQRLIQASHRWGAGRTALIHAAALASAAVVGATLTGADGDAGLLVVGLLLAFSLTQTAPAWFEALERVMASTTSMTRVAALEAGIPDSTEPGPTLATEHISQREDQPSAAPVRLEGVSFTYPGSGSLPPLLRFSGTTGLQERATVLHDVSLDVAAGELVAIVGQSGAGKSTIARLVAGLYTPSAGNVTVGGRIAASADSRSPSVALVPDRPWLIDASLIENVRYGTPMASLDDVYLACRRASVLAFAECLPAGLNTPMGVNGSRLSAGERQRVALARALVRQPEVLILDEATSLLDADSEAAIRGAITDELTGMTRIVIAHRLSTVQDADHIFVLAAGAIVDHGTHEQLRQQSKAYARWVELQAV